MQNEETPRRHTILDSVEYLPEQEVITGVDNIIHNMRGMLVALS